MTGVSVGARAISLSQRRRDVNTVLLLHGDGVDGATSFPDASGFTPANSVAAQNATVTSANPKFDQSITFTGSDARLSISPSTNFDFGSGNFTIDFWLRIPSAPTATFYLVHRLTTFAPFHCYMNTTRTIDAYFSNTGTSWIGNITGSAGSAVPTNTWTHVAIVRNGSVFTLYVNGVSCGTLSSAAALWVNSAPLYIAGLSGTPNGSGGIVSQIDEFRVSRIARWTTAFTPPTAPYS